MTKAEGTFAKCEQFLEFLKELPWCKQKNEVLVAVSKCTPEVIEVMGDHEVKVFPGNMIVRMNRSTLHNFREKYDEGQPLPVVLVWKRGGVEIWYRKHKSAEFPYDAWSNPAAAGYEREQVFIPKENMGANFDKFYAEIMARVKECPSSIPPQ